MSETNLIGKPVVIQMNTPKEDHVKGKVLSLSTSGLILEEVGRKITYHNFYPWTIIRCVKHEVSRKEKKETEKVTA